MERFGGNKDEVLGRGEDTLKDKHCVLE